jgi:hypothetical protein
MRLGLDICDSLLCVAEAGDTLAGRVRNSVCDEPVELSRIEALAEHDCELGAGGVPDSRVHLPIGYLLEA